jgi:hypothetical protein
MLKVLVGLIAAGFLGACLGCGESVPEQSKEEAIKSRQEAQKEKGPGGGKYMMPKGPKTGPKTDK